MFEPQGDYGKAKIEKWQGRRYEEDEVGIAMVFCNEDNSRYRYWIAYTLHYYQFSCFIDDFRKEANYFLSLNEPAHALVSFFGM